MRELRVEDALLYLDQVKVEFGDRPQIYNEFLDIMKTFKTQQLDTPGVIRRVSTLFRGNKKLVLGFNTFLPEGYKIEVPGDGPPVATYSAPGQGVTQILGPGLGGPMAMASLTQVAGNSQGAAKMNGAASPQPSIPPPPHPRQGAPPMQHQPQQQQLQQGQSQSAVPPPSHGPQPGPGGVMPAEQMGSKPPPAQQHQSSPHGPSSNGHGQDGHAPTAGGPQPEMSSPQGPVQPGGTVPKQGYGPPQPPPQDPKEPPVEFDHAINYVTTIKKRFAGEPDTYKKFLEILHTYQKEQRGIKEVLDEVSTLFADHPDLLKQFTYFLPDAVQAQAKAQLDAVAKEAEARKRAASSKQAIMQTAQGMQRQAIRGQPIGAGGTVPARAYGPQVNVPFGATQGRSDEREREICRTSIYGSVSFNPVRPPKRYVLKRKYKEDTRSCQCSNPLTSLFV
jgi:paired amphipathic helix protein Sin3a